MAPSVHVQTREKRCREMCMRAASEHPWQQERVGVWDWIVCVCVTVHAAHGELLL